MIIDARAVANGTTLHAEVCVVGGGPAGIITALELDRLGRQVLLLESGDTLASEAANTALNEGEVGGQPIFAMFGNQQRLTDVRVRQLGGGSNKFLGFSHPFDDLDLEDWPITRADFDAWYPVAHDYWGFGPVDYSPAYWAGQAGKVEPPSFGPGIECKVGQQVAKKFGPAYLPTLTSSAGIRLVHHANVTNVNVAPGGSTVTSLTVQTLAGGQFVVTADAYVLATGGIEVPRLLLASNDVVAAGVGNQHDLVGRYYGDHFASGVAFLYLRPSLGELGILGGAQGVATTTPGGAATTVNIFGILDLSTAARAALDMPSLHLEMTLADLVEYPAQAAGVHGAQGAELMRAGAGAPKSIGLVRTHLQPLPNPASRVSLGTGTDAFGKPVARVEWHSTAADAENRRKAMRYFAGQIATSGAGLLHNTLGWVMPDPTLPGTTTAGKLRITPVGDEPDPYDETTFHHMCTARMADVETDGVVDPDCRVHTTDNLYIAGSAVFSRPMGFFPTLHIVALAARLASHLDGVLP